MFIDIPTPCHEDWSNMSPCEQGRHCGSCKKNVIDFDALSNAEATRLLTVNNNICGRINGAKLARLNFLVPILLATSCVSANASEPPSTCENHHLPIDCVGEKPNTDTLIISGTLTDSITKEPIAFASITVSNKNKVLTTVTADVDGRYEIRIASSLLQPSFDVAITSVGYKERTVLGLKPSKKKCYLPMKMSPQTELMIMGGMGMTIEKPLDNRAAITYTQDDIRYIIH